MLGEHRGLIHYTVGQRKGLGIALGCPQFVVSKNAKDNTVVLSPDEKMLFKTKVFIRDISLMSGTVPDKPFNCTAKLRYSAPDTECTVYPRADRTAVIEFASPVRAPSPGQSAVFYRDDIVLGGGIIVLMNELRRLKKPLRKTT